GSEETRCEEENAAIRETARGDEERGQIGKPISSERHERSQDGAARIVPLRERAHGVLARTERIGRSKRVLEDAPKSLRADDRARHIEQAEERSRALENAQIVGSARIERGAFGLGRVDPEAASERVVRILSTRRKRARSPAGP